MSDSTEDTSASTTSPDTSASTVCEYNDSVTDFFKCNKEKFSTTQLVGGGIGVTLIIFGLAFAIIWFCRRKKALPQEKKKDIEKSKKADEAEDSDEEEESDEDERDHKRDQKSPSATSGAAARARAAQQASLDQRRSEAEKAPPRPPRTEQTLGHDLNPQSHSHPSSRASSRAGSPTSSPHGPHVRQLSPTNPDYRNSARASRAAPALNRPPSSISKPSQQPQRPQTAYQNQARQPVVSSGLGPQDPRTVRASSYVPQEGDRRPSQAQNPRAHSVHPPSGNPTRSSSRSSSVSMYSTTNRKPSYTDIPLPALPSEAHHKARSESVYSTASRRESPPGYTSASSRETSPKMKAQAPARLVGSHPGVSRQSTAASVQTFDDAREYLDEKPQVPSRRTQMKQQAMAESPLPYERSP